MSTLEDAEFRLVSDTEETDLLGLNLLEIDVDRDRSTEVVRDADFGLVSL